MGKAYSLDDIENDVLRPVYKEPVNCASYGCPNSRSSLV